MTRDCSHSPHTSPEDKFWCVGLSRQGEIAGSQSPLGETAPLSAIGV